MNTQTKIGIGLAVLLAGLAAVRLGLFSKGPDDQELIRSAMNDAVAAAREGRAGPVLDFISDQIAVSGYPTPNKRQIAQYVRQFKPEVTVSDSKAEISGDSATLTTAVNFKVPGPMGVNLDVESVTLLFQRENSVKWLIFPSKTWRLTKVSTDGAPALDELK